MRFLEILVLLGLCLVFTKAESDLNDGTLDDFLDEKLSEKASMDNEPEEETLKEDDEPEEATLKEDPKEEARRRFRRPPFSRSITIPIGIPANINSRFFTARYCFRRRCLGKYDESTF